MKSIINGKNRLVTIFALFLLSTSCTKASLKKHYTYVIDIDEEAFYDFLVENDSKLILLYFWDRSSGVYDSLYSIMDELSIYYKDKIKICRVNVSGNLRMFEKAGCSVHCTVIFFKNTEEIDRCSGLINKENLKAMISSYLK